MVELQLGNAVIGNRKVIGKYAQNYVGSRGHHSQLLHGIAEFLNVSIFYAYCSVLSHSNVLKGEPIQNITTMKTNIEIVECFFS